MKKHADIIPLLAQRSTGEKLNAAVEFVKLHRRNLLRWWWVVLPLAIATSTAMFGVLQGLFGDNAVHGTDLQLALLIVLGLLTLTVLCCMATITARRQEDTGSSDASLYTFKHLRPLLARNMAGGACTAIGMSLLVSLPCALAWNISRSLGVMIFVGIVFFLPFTFLVGHVLMIAPTHALENRNMMHSVRRAFKLTTSTYFSFLGFQLLLLLTALLMQGVMMVPWIIFDIVHDVLLQQSVAQSITSTITFEVICFCYTVVHCLYLFFTLLLVIVGMCFHYGSSTQQASLSDAALSRDIDNFESLT